MTNPPVLHGKATPLRKLLDWATSSADRSRTVPQRSARCSRQIPWNPWTMRSRDIVTDHSLSETLVIFTNPFTSNSQTPIVWNFKDVSCLFFSWCKNYKIKKILCNFENMLAITCFCKTRTWKNAFHIVLARKTTTVFTKITNKHFAAAIKASIHFLLLPNLGSTSGAGRLWGISWWYTIS